MCTCSMRIACKPGSEMPEHLNLSRTPAPFLSARLTQSRVVCVFACLSRPSTGTLTPPPPTNDAGAGRDLMANVTPGVRWLRSLGRYASDLAQWLWRTQPLLAVLAAICVSSFVWIVFSSCLERRVRLVGMALQLLGVILVAVGLRDTRRAFEDQPTSHDGTAFLVPIPKRSTSP
jgi:hypothetical protein